MMRAFVFAVSVAGLAACASAPAAPVLLTDEEYQAVMAATAVRNVPGGDPFQEVRNVSAVLERKDLTADQRLRTLYRRAVIRTNTGEDKLGGIKDYADFIAAAPAGHDLLEHAQKNKTYTEGQMDYINRRIAEGPEKDRNQYFNDLLSSGRHDEAAAVFREGRVTTIFAVEKLAKLGYLCEGDGYSGPSYRWGYDNTGYRDVRWCDTRSGG